MASTVKEINNYRNWHNLKHPFLRVITTRGEQETETTLMRLEILFGLFLIGQAGMAQTSCPPGSQMRKVKCNGKVEYRCVPNQYTCQGCWVVAFAACPGTKEGVEITFNSYQDALNRAQNEGSNWRENHSICVWYDNEKYEIYLKDNKLCDGSTSNQGKLIVADLVKRITPLYNRMKAEIDNYKRRIAGKSYRPGAVLDEFNENLSLAEEKAKKVEAYLKNLNEENTAKLESAFKDLEDEMTSLKNLSPQLNVQTNNPPSNSVSPNDDFWESTPQKNKTANETKSQSDNYKQKADEAVARGDYKKAEEHLREANRINPSQTNLQQLKQLETLSNAQATYNKTMEVNKMVMSEFDGTANGSLMTLAKGTGAMLATGELNAGVVAGGLGLLLAGKSPERKAKEEKEAAEAARALAIKKENERQETLSKNYLNSIIRSEFVNTVNAYDQTSVYTYYVVRTNKNLVLTNVFKITRSKDGDWPYRVDIEKKLKQQLMRDMPTLITNETQFYVQKFFIDPNQAEIQRTNEIQKIKNNYCSGFTYDKFYPFGFAENSKENNIPVKKEKSTKSDFWDQ